MLDAILDLDGLGVPIILLIIFASGVVLALCLDRKDTEDCWAQVYAAGLTDRGDAGVFLELTAAKPCDLAASPSLRSEYLRWQSGEIIIDGSAKRAKDAEDRASTAEAMGAAAIMYSAASRH